MYFSNACIVEAPGRAASIVFQSPSLKLLAQRSFSGQALASLLFVAFIAQLYNNTDSTSCNSPKSVSMSVWSKAILPCPSGGSKKIRCSCFSNLSS